MNPDAIIKVRFLTKLEGGRNEPISKMPYGCPLMINGQGYDCRFIANQHDCFKLGETYEIPIKFLNPSLALMSISESNEITLWEGKIIAKGHVIKVFTSQL